MEQEQNTRLGPWPFHKHERSRSDGLCFSPRPYVSVWNVRLTAQLRSVDLAPLPGWHHWKPPVRPASWLQYQHKNQAKGSFANCKWIHGTAATAFVFPPKGGCLENKGICSRWQGCFSRSLESKLPWEQPDSTESWSEAGCHATVQPFSRNTKRTLVKKFHRERILQISHAYLQRAPSNLFMRKVRFSKCHQNFMAC